MKWHPNKDHPDHSRIALLTRFPVASRVKTRLISALGGEGAAKLHRSLTERVAIEALALTATREAQVEVWHDGGTLRQMQSWLGSLPRYRQQPSGDLGQRILAVFNSAFHEGARRCVAIGSDCPAITGMHLRKALRTLDEVDVVLGPATDGGYWLIGLNSFVAWALPSLLNRIEWGSGRVLQQSIDRAKQQNLSFTLLEQLSDVDRPEDLYEWTQYRDPPPESMKISVVIPTLNEKEWIYNAIISAYRGGIKEVIVADGGSSDDTCEISSSAGAKVVKTPRGRARQMNAGAMHVTGDAILFLHADTTLPLSTASLVKCALAPPGVVAGAFTYSTHGAGRLDSILNIGGRWRCQVSKHPYGDQGLFMRKRTFESLGGFPDIPVMEDWELVYRLRKLGQVVILPETIVTSCASFVDYGFVRASLLNLVAIFGYQLGIDPYHLADWRNRIARRSS